MGRRAARPSKQPSPQGNRGSASLTPAATFVGLVLSQKRRGKDGSAGERLSSSPMATGPVAARRVPIFDLDGTLLDSDEALTAPFVALGIAPDAVPFGMTLVEACGRLGVTLDDYLSHYDARAVRPFPGISRLLKSLDQWAIFSNKLRSAGEQEVHALGWQPDVALFFESFGGPKTLTPVLDAMRLDPSEAVCVGDSEHDRACAHAAGVDFAIAAWNPRVVAARSDLVLREPQQLLDIL